MFDLLYALSQYFLLLRVVMLVFGVLLECIIFKATSIINTINIILKMLNVSLVKTGEVAALLYGLLAYLNKHYLNKIY